MKISGKKKPIIKTTYFYYLASLKDNLIRLSSSFNSLNDTVKVICAVVFIYSSARLLVDGFILPLMGRSLSQGGDFQVYYVVGAMLRNDYNIYDSELYLRMTPIFIGHEMASEHHIFLYPPLIAIIMTPLSLLSVNIAYKIWVIIQFVCLLISLYILALNLPSLKAWGLPFLFVLASNMYPIYLSIDIGQVTNILLLLFVLIVHFARREKYFIAGLLLGIGGMIKIVPFILIGFFLLQRRWRAILGLLVSITVLSLIFYLLLGTNVLQSFFNNILSHEIPSQVSFLANASIHGVIFRLSNRLGMMSMETPLRGLIVVIIMITLAVISNKYLTSTEPRYTLLLGTWIISIFIISPTTWEHSLSWILIAFGALVALLVESGKRLSPIVLLLLGLIYTLLAFENLPLNRFGQWKFESGWWIFSGQYLQYSFFADVRFIGYFSFFIMCIVAILCNQHAVQGCLSKPNSGSANPK